MQGPEIGTVMVICIWVCRLQMSLTLSKAVEQARGCVAANIGFGAMVANASNL